MADNVQSIFLVFIYMFWNIMKRLEKLERSLHVYQEKMDGNILKTSEEIANPHVSSLKKPGGTSVMKMTKFMLDDVAVESEDGISEIEDIHRECIQEHLPLMCDDITLKRSYLLDELVENSCLTENEATDIRELEKRKDQNRKLAVTISKRSRTKFSSFLEVLKRTENYPHIAEKLESSYNTLADEKRKKKECIYCYIVRNVNMRDIIDILCSQKIVDLSFLDEVISCNDHDTERWKNLWMRLIYGINKVRNGNSLEIFQDSLKPKYEHISRKLKKDKKIMCTCERRDISDKMSWPSGSYTTEEWSTTSTTFGLKSQASAKSVISTISESHSDISNEEVYSNFPRTIQWVVSHSRENSVTFYEESQEASTQFCKGAERKDLGAELPIKKEKVSTLLDVGNDLLLNVALEESRMVESCRKNSSSPPIFKPDDTTQHETKHSFEKSQTKTTKSSKRKKKKRKKKHNTSNQPEYSVENSGIQLAQENLSSANSTGNRRTIGDRLISNIPVDSVDSAPIGKCCEKSCSDCTIQQTASPGPVVLTESRHLDPLVKVGFCGKLKNYKK
ncbi:uncharacterized protein LOC128192737 [Crassostrea angulata]|uniref:uncharacterized protein LOC128192737 n=1 Tax=Magallana angulata TaxID=2784310 RepID=UPI0022B0D966|nr:uncharacterized protein LOC128192737 [Crassostrea angulata]